MDTDGHRWTHCDLTSADELSPRKMRLHLSDIKPSSHDIDLRLVYSIPSHPQKGGDEL